MSCVTFPGRQIPTVWVGGRPDLNQPKVSVFDDTEKRLNVFRVVPLSVQDGWEEANKGLKHNSINKCSAVLTVDSIQKLKLK